MVPEGKQPGAFDTFAVAGIAVVGCTVVAVEHTAAAAAAVGRIVVVVVDIVEMVPSSLAPRASEHRELRLRNSHKQGVCPIPGCKRGSDCNLLFLRQP